MINLNEKMSTIKPFIFGGLASLTAEFGTFPLDTTKTRLQVQGQHKDVMCFNSKYRGMTHALLRISQEEGVSALYKGIAPALLRQASYGTLKIGLYHYLKRLMVERPQDETIYTNVVAGVISGAVSSSIANPTDLLKVRMQSGTDQSYSQRTSVVRFFKQIYSEEGIRGLYRGVGPTAQRAAVVAGVLLPSYDYFKKAILDYGLMADNISTHFCASFLAGIIGTAASNPIDVIKSRMMNQTVLRQAAHLYSGSIDCFVTTLRTEGARALYKGFFPAYFRIGPWNIIFFITYEKLKDLF
ncbi:kidney mitochondrial carrier protein 1-like isoform X1 [Halichondria panicea]|uniref:kidney mitochondrial carrier protein 1-like isoform X1 n=1 Tax=Halichondria panicea TaxID=6063 RepID=UPI00312B9FF3